MTDQVLRDALRAACRELVTWREWGYTKLTPPDANEADVDDVVSEFLDKARGFEGSEGAP